MWTMERYDSCKALCVDIVVNVHCTYILTRFLLEE